VDSRDGGPVGVEILEKRGEVELKLMVAGDDARRWIEGKRDDIMEIFSRGGLSLKHLSVECGGGRGGRRAAEAGGDDTDAPEPGKTGGAAAADPAVEARTGLEIIA
jgi:hypothetical protein